MPGTIELLEATVEGLQYELHVREIRLKEKDKLIAELEQQVEDLKKQAVHGGEEKSAGEVPPWVKPNMRRRRRKKPGRKKGHEAALRPMPVKIDHHQEVPLTRDDRGQALCPRCQCRLEKLRKHKRIVEDLIRSTVKTTCYHSHSGYCPHCRKRIESRHPEQPPAANLPHGQLGLNALEVFPKAVDERDKLKRLFVLRRRTRCRRSGLAVSHSRSIFARLIPPSSPA